MTKQTIPSTCTLVLNKARGRVNWVIWRVAMWLLYFLRNISTFWGITQEVFSQPGCYVAVLQIILSTISTGIGPNET